MSTQQHKKYVPVENHSGYSRDVRSKAIVSTNTSGYDTFVAKQKERRDMKTRLENVELTLDRILEKLENIGK